MTYKLQGMCSHISRIKKSVHSTHAITLLILDAAQCTLHQRKRSGFGRAFYLFGDQLGTVKRWTLKLELDLIQFGQICPTSLDTSLPAKGYEFLSLKKI